jgi:NADH-ubiquinone oxidoreductase chain 2
MFFDWHSYTYFNKLQNLQIPVLITKKDKVLKKIYFDSGFALSSSFSLGISILTLLILLFMFMPNEWLHMSNILSIVLFMPNNI